MSLQSALATRQRFVGDFHRPVYHFLPPSNWMNDPNGVIHWKGEYHLFYQFNPFGAEWGNMHWGHAVSPDLVHWTDLPLALAPTPGGPDEAGCFSGCAVDNDGVPTLLYTGTRGQQYDIQTQCLAMSNDGLRTWEKFAGNPVLKDVPPQSGQTADFRDPFVWREGDTWYMVVASRVQGVGGAVFLYRSTTLYDWEYLHPLLVGDLNRNGVIWECPNFFPLDGRWVLIISSHTGERTDIVRYFVGTYEKLRFVPFHEAVLDAAELYAPLTMMDEGGRRLLWGWIRESRPVTEQVAARWSGVQCIPRVLGLDAQNRLTMRPAPEIERLRGRHHHLTATSTDEQICLAARGMAFDIAVEFMPEPDGCCGLSLGMSPAGDSRLDIIYEASRQRLVIGEVRDGTAESNPPYYREAVHGLDDSEPLRLRILLDGSVVEVIANDRTSVTHRLYPGQRTHDGVQLSLTRTKLQHFEAWEMPAIWGIPAT